MKRKNLISALLVAGLLATMPMAINAAGLGSLKIISALGQPLRAEIDLISIPKDEIDLLTARIATPEAYKQAKLERQEGLSAIRFSVEKRANGEPYLKVSSIQAFNEPFIQLLIQLDWPTGRLLREYTLLLDPPGFSEVAAAPRVSAPVARVEPIAKPAIETQASAVKPGLAEAAPKTSKKEPKKAVEKEEAAKPGKAQAKKEAPIIKAEPARALTPAEQTFPRFDSDADSAAAQQPAPITTALVPAEKAPEYVVKKGDSLAKIARETQVEGYSLEQMMVALYETNQSAFDGKNMNRIRAGKTLNVPDKSEIDASNASQAAAAKEIRAHAADWNAYRQKLAGAVADQQPAPVEAKPEVSGKITAKAEDKGAKADEPSKDVLKLSKGETAGAGDAGKGSGAEAKALKEKLSAAQDEAVAKEKSLKEANSRITELDKNIKDMQALLELKNKQLADLEKQAKAKPAEPPKPDAAKEPVAAVAPEKQPEPLLQAIPDKSPEPKKPAPKAKPVPLPEPETSFMDTVLSNPLYMGGSAAAIVGALFAGLWAIGRRRKKSLASFEDSIMTGSDLKTNTVFGNTAGGQIDTGDTSFLTDFSQAGMGAIDTNDVDPIAEAEVYMAYGRDAQAEEILKEAMSKDPERHEIQLKLLEIYAGRKNTGAFETLAAELYAATSGQGPSWKKAAELGRGLDPANPLYTSPEDRGDGGGMAALAVAGAAGAAAVAQDLDFSLDIDTQGGVDQTAAAVADEDMGGALDFDLDTIGGLPPADREAQSSASAEAAESLKDAENLAALDFDLDTIIPQAVEKNAEEPALMASLGLDNLKFDAPFLPDESASAPTAEATLEVDTLALDFDFNLDQIPNTEATSSQASTEEPIMPDLDLSGIDLNFEGANEAEQSLEDATTLAGDSTIWEESSTKLDLARAYLEMGDKEGAREILLEVSAEGGPEQQADANKLLATLS